MVYFNLYTAIKMFYYLLSIDEMIEDEEIIKLDEIGNELLGEAYNSSKDEILSECFKVVSSALSSENSYEIIVASADRLLQQKEAHNELISVRLFIWDALVISFSNNCFAPEQRSFIHHICNHFKIDNSVVLEMEQAIRTLTAIDNEIVFLQNYEASTEDFSSRIAELNARKTFIFDDVKELIANKTEKKIEAVTVKEDFIDKAKNAVMDKAKQVVNKKTAKKK